MSDNKEFFFLSFFFEFVMPAWSVMCFQADGFQACHVNPSFSVSPLMGESVQMQSIPYSIWEAMVAVIYMVLHVS